MAEKTNLVSLAIDKMDTFFAKLYHSVDLGRNRISEWRDREWDPQISKIFYKFLKVFTNDLTFTKS